jgi:integrase
MGTLFKRARNGKKSNWIAEYTDHTGERVQKSTRTTDKKTAQQILDHWKNEAALRSSGRIDADSERAKQQSLRPLTEHRDEWLRSLRAKGKSEIHLKFHEKRLQAIIDHSKWTTIREITPESVEAFIESLRSLDRSNQTIAHYTQAAKQFTRWLARTHRLSRDPLMTLQKPNPRADRRRERRMLLPEEWPWLRTAAGPRTLIYEVAIQTGLRASEIRAIHPSQVKHLEKPPHILVKSGDTKDHKLARQYITADLAQRLSMHAPASRNELFELPDEYSMASMLRADLATAREAWASVQKDKKEVPKSDFLLPENHAKEQLDFHSLRHTCGAWLAMRGVHPKTIQTVMRHKTITLTMDTYGHLFPNAEPAAIAEIGEILKRQ